MIGIVIGALFVVGSIYNYLHADKLVETIVVAAETTGKPIPWVQRWVVGSPPSADKARRQALLSGGFFGLLLVLKLLTL